MTISYKNYTLTPGNGAYTWDLKKTIDVIANSQVMAEKHNVKVGEKTGNTREITVGYDYRLESALRVMIEMSLADKEDIVSLSEYLIAYTKEKKEVVDLIRSKLGVAV